MVTSIEIILPRLMWEQSLAAELLSKGLIDSERLIIPDCNVSLDWRKVRFFEDMALLKLIMIEYRLRKENLRVIHTGIRDNFRVEGVLRQLFACGYLELMASAQLWNPSKEIAEDLSELLTTPSVIISPRNHRPLVMRIVACHIEGHFSRASREARRITEFTEAEHRLAFVEGMAKSSCMGWKLINTGEFRNLILEQARRNVLDHADATLGLSCARILDPATFAEEWQRGFKESYLESVSKEDIYNEVIESNTRFAAQIREDFKAGNALIHTTAIDNGKGIIKTISKGSSKDYDFLSEVLNVSRAAEKQDQITKGMFSDSKVHFHTRFENGTTQWTSKHKLLAFATDPKGTHKPRCPGSEKKGLTTLVDAYVMKQSGRLHLESGMYGLIFNATDVTSTEIKQHLANSGEGEYRYYGIPVRTDLPYMDRIKQGTTVALTTRLGQLIDISQTSTRNSPIVSASNINQSSLKVNTVDVKAAWDISKGADRARRCAEMLKKEAIRKGTTPELCIYDWSEMRPAPEQQGDVRIDKVILNRILYELAGALSQEETNKMDALVFAHFPEEMVPLLSVAMKGFSDFALAPAPPMPIALFIMGSRELKWLWLNCKKEAHNYVLEEFNRIITPGLRKRLPATATTESYWKAEADKWLQRCPLFKSIQYRAPDGDSYSKHVFEPYFTLNEITAQIKEHFREKLETSITEAHSDLQYEGGLLLHQTYVVTDYYRCDILVDNSIADELAEELTNIARGFAAETPNKKIDYVVSCTSPTHWFVHKIVDGLKQYGIDSGHYVFAAPSSIKTEIINTGIREGHNVVIFSDVISTGSLALEMAKYVKDMGAHLTGLIAIIDTREPDIKQKRDSITSMFDGRDVMLIRLPVRKNYNENAVRNAKWQIHRDTATPIRRVERGKEQLRAKYESEVYDGVGNLKQLNSFWGNKAQTALRHLNAAKALRVGHFQHGSHHSMVYCDVKRAFTDIALRDAFVSALFWYVVIHEIDLVVCPNDSGVYLIRDELVQRFPQETKHIPHFATASRVNKAEHGYTHILTTLNSDYRGTWPADIKQVLLIDDGIVSGETIRNLIAEVVDASRKQKELKKNRAIKSKAGVSPKTTLNSIHIAAFVNRLAERQTSFYRNLEEFTNQLFDQQKASSTFNPRILFSTLLSLPIKAYPEEACPICQRLKRITETAVNKDVLSCIRHFYYEWQRDLTTLNPHESPSAQRDSTNIVEGKDARKIASALIAINDGEIAAVMENQQEMSFSLRNQVTSALLDNSLDLRMSPEQRLKALADLIKIADSEFKTGGEQTTDALNICSALLRTITGHLMDFPLLPSLHTKTLGLGLLTVTGPHLHDDRTLWALAAFVSIALEYINDKEPKRLVAIQEDWLKCLDGLSIDDAYGKANVSWLKHCIVKPESRLSSVGNATYRLHQIASKMKDGHPHSRESIEEAYSALDDFDVYSNYDIQGEGGELLRRALVTFDEIIQCVEIIDINGKESDIIEGTSNIITNINTALATGYNTNESSDKQNKDYLDTIITQYQDLYNIWFGKSIDPSRFPEPEQPIFSVLEQYRANLLNCWKAAWKKTPYNESITVDKDKVSILNVEVLCDKKLLENIFLQIFHNLRKHQSADAKIVVAAKTLKPKAHGAKLRVLLTNTGTLSKNKNTLGGLTDLNWRIKEYGGSLEWDPDNTEKTWPITLVCVPWE